MGERLPMPGRFPGPPARLWCSARMNAEGPDPDPGPPALKRRRLTWGILLCLTALVGLAGVGVSSRLSSQSAPAAGRAPSLTVASRTLYPGFDRRRHRYVARCPA